jgi:hypothetical protein
MATGRFAGDALTLRFGAMPLVRGGGLLAALGLGLALVAGSSWAAIVGFGAVGAGFSVAFPLMLARAGSLPGTTPGTAIATVSVFGYTGFLAGPPVIGFVSQATNLRGGLSGRRADEPHGRGAGGWVPRVGARRAELEAGGVASPASRSASESRNNDHADVAETAGSDFAPKLARPTSRD